MMRWPQPRRPGSEMPSRAFLNRKNLKPALTEGRVSVRPSTIRSAGFSVAPDSGGWIKSSRDLNSALQPAGAAGGASGRA